MPVIPKNYGGTRSLNNFKYRNANLDITVEGFGNQIASVTIDGKSADKAIIPATFTGKHTVNIKMKNNDFSGDAIHLVENKFSLANPIATLSGDKITWNKDANAKGYTVYKNGKQVENTTSAVYQISDNTYAEYTISAVDAAGQESFMCEPLVYSKSQPLVIEVEDFVAPSDLNFVNYSGKGFVEVSTDKNTKLSLPIVVEEGGEYFIDIKYSNGSGPWNTDNKCAIRSLYLNKDYIGVMVLPQRGTNEWSDWGLSNSYKINLVKGKNELELILEEWNNNMNVDVNRAMIDAIRLYRVQ
jgi:hypothetical protein